MNDKIKIIKYFRRSEMHSYLFSLFNELIKTNVKDGIIYTKNNQYIVFAVDDNTLYFSNKYIWKELRNTYNIRMYNDIINIVKEVIELLYSEYKDYNIHYSVINSNIQQFVSKNKLNKIYLENNNYSKLKLFYISEDCKVTYKYSNSEFILNKDTLVYFNGCNWYKINNEFKNINTNKYYFPENDNIIELDFNNKEHYKIFNWYKPHMLINKYNTNYYFQ